MTIALICGLLGFVGLISSAAPKIPTISTSLEKREQIIKEFNSNCDNLKENDWTVWKSKKTEKLLYPKFKNPQDPSTHIDKMYPPLQEYEHIDICFSECLPNVKKLI